tara:strand:+ start:3902 stop:4237 length:336 start_codon:yes stop_codon:yes gene_type:complete
MAKKKNTMSEDAPESFQVSREGEVSSDVNYDATSNSEPSGEMVAETPPEEVVVTETVPVKAVNMSLVSGAFMVLRGGKWPKDYKFRVGNNSWVYATDKTSFLKALGDALPD